MYDQPELSNANEQLISVITASPVREGKGAFPNHLLEGPQGQGITQDGAGILHPLAMGTLVPWVLAELLGAGGGCALLEEDGDGCISHAPSSCIGIHAAQPLLLGLQMTLISLPEPSL